LNDKASVARVEREMEDGVKEEVEEQDIQGLEGSARTLEGHGKTLGIWAEWEDATHHL
jgi:uncharacterized protein YcaQ